MPTSKPGWRHHAFRANGDGTFTPLAWDIPVSDAQVTEDLSGPGAFTGTVSPEVQRLKAGGAPVLVQWSTVIVSERDGVLMGVGILDEPTVDGADLSIQCRGFAGYPGGMLYTGLDYSGIRVDPLDLVRRIWVHVQSQAWGDLGVTVDDTTSPVRIGEEPRDVSFETDAGAVEFETGPYVLARWKTDDLGKALDDLAEETPFDWRMEHAWSGDGNDFTSFLRLGYPRLGVRRSRGRFVVGENVIAQPPIDHDEYASEVHVLGAGEGRDMRHGSDKRVTGRLRRAVVVSDKSRASNRSCDALARTELAMRIGSEDISEITVVDHPNARFGTWQVGDEIHVQTAEGWHEKLSLWVRILSQTWNVDEDTVTLTVKRVEKV